MIKSFRIFVGKNFTKRTFISSAVLFAAAVSLGLLKNVNVNGLAPVRDFIAGWVPGFCGIIFPVTATVYMSQIYNANMRDQPGGYKYFHAIPNSDSHFQRAIIFGNLLSLILISPAYAALVILFPSDMMLVLAAFALLTVGVMNFFGHVRSIYGRIIPLMVMSGGIGTFWAIGQDLNEISFPVYIFLGIAAVVYIASFIFTAAMAKSAWNREDKEKNKEKTPEKTEKISPQKAKYGGAQFIINGLLRVPKAALIIVIVMVLIFGILPFICHVEIGDEEYLLPKAFIFFPSALFIEFCAIFTSRDIGGNKLIRSSPIAKRLYTRSLPAAISIFTVGFSTLMIGIYFVFLAAIGAEISQFSDTLIIGAIVVGSLLFFAPTLMETPAGGVFMVYVATLPLVAVILLVGKERKLNGFGVPLYLSALLYLFAAVLGTVWGFYICKRNFRKNDVKIAAQVVNQ